jgi:GNAT superfamily N-acetyltransferase
LRVVELTARDVQVLQRFFEANPAYFVTVTGEPAQGAEARDEILGDLPSGFPYTRKWAIGYLDAKDEVVATATVVSDLFARGVWHVGLFMLSSARHGTGEAQVLYRALESWAVASGARWMRLGVVRGNARAECFWERFGFVETRTREVQMGKRVSVVRVLVKSLCDEPVEDYLLRVERDRPGSG